MFIYSASYHGNPRRRSRGFYKMQMVWFVVGLLVYLAAALVDYRLICQRATVWYAYALG